jgi:hypothetical protein
MAYIHNSSYKYGKLSPRGKKCIFIKYSETSKGHIFIGEDLDGTVTEFKSRDSTFLENEFPSNRDVSTDERLFEAVSQDDNAIASEIEEKGGYENVSQFQDVNNIVEEATPVENVIEPHRST